MVFKLILGCLVFMVVLIYVRLSKLFFFFNFNINLIVVNINIVKEIKDFVEDF